MGLAEQLPADVLGYLYKQAKYGDEDAGDLLRKYDPEPPTPNTKEQNIAFRKAWDARVEAGKSHTSS